MALRMLLHRALAALIWLARKMARVLARAQDRLATDEVMAADGRARLEQAMHKHDMMTTLGEDYYASCYEDWVDHNVPEGLSGRWLDAGCGSGRLTIPLAERLGERGCVCAVDLLPDSVERARRFISTAGLSNVDLEVADLHDFLRRQEAESFDGVLFFEVGFLMLDLEGALHELARGLRSGAPLLGSFRNLGFHVHLAARERNWELARAIFERRSGPLPGMGYQNWHTPAEVQELLERTGFSSVSLMGLGVASGIDGDPLSALADPSRLGITDRDELARLERAYGAIEPGAGRYILAAARRI